MKTTDDFKKARVGSAAIQVCPVCNTEMGILLKSKGPMVSDDLEYTGPRNIAVEGELCEFCHFLGMYWAQEGKVEGAKYGCAKIVKENNELVAFVPFTDQEERIGHLADGTEYEFKHGMILELEDTEDGKGKITKILDKGRE